MLVVLTDGNDTASKMPPDKAAEIAGQNNIRIHAIGIAIQMLARRGEARHGSSAEDRLCDRRAIFLRPGPQRLQISTLCSTSITPANQKTLSWRPRIELFHYPLGAAVLLVLGYHGLMWLCRSARPQA